MVHAAVASKLTNLGQNSIPGNLTNVNGTLFFTVDSATGQELWKSDGTAAGTTKVTSVVWNFPRDFINVNGTLFFAADDGTSGDELWKSDGTLAGTMIVKDINSNPTSAASSSPFNLTNVNGTLFFAADDGTSGKELWKSDGTAAGTLRVQDINSNPTSAASSSPLQPHQCKWHSVF